VIEEAVAGPDAVPRLELRAWKDRFGLTAGITTRGPSGDYSLGLWSGTEPVGRAMERWDAFRRAFAPGFGALVLGRQIHGRDVRWQGPGADGWILVEGCDGHATRERGVLLAVTVADCVPVYLADPASGAVGLLHAGWRGTAAGILEAGVALLNERVSAARENIVIHCGVSICGWCYEVGPEVVREVTGSHVEKPERLDLRAELARRARAAGVREVTVSPFCAAHDADRFHSHRASGGRGGRMVAYLGRAAPGA
jgi:YfiH family protein